MGSSQDFKDIQFDLQGIQLAAKSWFDHQEKTIIALHGWLDNANSFDDLVSHFPQYHWLAIDMVGHGLSSHRQGRYYIWEYAMDVAELVNQLGKPVHILGHSLGAAVATLSTPLIKEKGLSLTLLEGAVPITSPSEDFAPRLIQAWEEPLAAQKIYPDFSQLVRQRQLSPIASLDEKRARVLMERATEKTPEGYKLLSDPRLRSPSAVRMTKEQVFSMVQKIDCPVYLLRAHQGLFKEVPQDLIAQFKTLTMDSIDGDHHFHMGETAKHVAKKIKDHLAL